MIPNLPILIWIAGLLHFGILLASGLTPRVLDWRNDLKPLPRLTRQLIWIHGAFIVLTIIGFGLLSLLNADALAGGSQLARTLCGFIALFWAARLTLQLTYVDAGAYLTHPVLKIGYHGLTAVFTFFTFTYAWAALCPGRHL